MRWIDFENKKPTDTDLQGWTPWTEQAWKDWLAESKRLFNELSALNTVRIGLETAGNAEESAKKLAERNKFIDDNSDHWGKLKPWLSALSHGKCWFTEAKDIASHMDVEHFRPKKVAKNMDETERDGYWWLAFDYTNYRLAGNVPNRMKGGWFPLHPTSLCSKHDAQCEESEDHCLLDPVVQTDADLIAFDNSGDAIPVPDSTDEWELKRVDLSITKYKLNKHDALPETRREVWKKMERIVEAYLKAKESYRPGINPSPNATIRGKAKEIRDMTRQEAELSSVALWCLRLGFPKNPELLRLVA